MSDPTMALVYDLAKSLGSVPLLPQSLQNVTARAVYMNHFDSNVIAKTPLWGNNGKFVIYHDKLTIFFDRTATESYSYVKDVSNRDERINITLRLWVGCIEAAKMIRFTSVADHRIYKLWSVTCEDVHTSSHRIKESLQIDIFSSTDCVYLAGVEAAPEFKKLRKEYYSFKGISQKSPVKNHPNEYLIKADTETVTEEKGDRTYRRFYVNL